jgi:hypothetical protein
MNKDESDQDRERRIRVRAYEIWDAEGRPHGRHEQHWREAEQEIAHAENATEPAGRIDPDRAADAAPSPRTESTDLKQRQDQLLDEAIEESFPGSDPISPKRIT